MSQERYLELCDLINTGHGVHLYGYSATSVEELDRVLEYPRVKDALAGEEAAAESKPEDEVKPPSNPDDLEKMTYPELRKLAKAEGVVLDGNPKKDEVVALIRTALAGE
jgi:hypothetical protein